MSDWRAGKVIGGKYELVDRVGQGGMGAVWRARHRELDALVALKELDGRLADTPLGRARFLREAKAAAALRSPHVIQIHDFGVDGSAPFIAMELLEGDSLAARLRLGPLGREATWRVLDQVLRAIGRAHQHGIVHRDLKPANIFITPNDAEESELLRETWLVKVLDFGIAKQVDASAPDELPPEVDLAAAEPEGGGAERPPSTDVSTETGAALGTPQYMSPEQARGKPVDGRSDLWAIGVIAYECLVGRPVFERAAFGALVLQICADPLPVPSSVAEVPAGFDAWFAKALARAPDDRFQTAAEMSEALRGVLAPAGPAAVAPANAATPSRRARAARWVVGLGAVAALGAGLAWWTARASTVPERREGAATGEASAPPERREAAFEQRRLTFLGLPSRGVIAPDGGSVLFATRDATGWTAWRQRGEEAPTELARLQKLWALALSPSGVALMVGERRADGPPVQLTVAADGAVTERETKAFFEAAWSPDGETLAGIEGSTRKDVALVARGSTADEGARRRVALDGDVQWLVDVGWAPSSDRVLVSVRTAQGARRLLAVPKDGGATVPLLPAEQTFTDFATSEDALFMLRPARGATELVRFAWGPGSAAPDERAEVLLSGLDASDLSVSRDGRKITFTKREASSNVWLVDTARGLRGKVELTRGAREHRAPAFSPGGEALAMVRRAKDVELVVMPSSGGPEHRVSAPGHVVSSLAWAPDGRSLAYATVPSGEGDEPRIFVGDREGGAPRAVTLDVAPSAGSDALGWAPGPLLWAQTSNNRNLVASDGERQREAPLFDAPVGWSFSPAPNARGDVAVFRNRGTKEEPFGVWIVGADGAPPRRVAEGRHFPLRFAPDGETLYVMTVGGAGDEPTALARIPRGGTPETVLTLDVAPDVVVGADITPDGARAALSVEKRSFDLWIAERP